MPKKICNYPECRELIDMKHTYCKDHGVSKDNHYRKYNRDKDRDKFYHSKKWKHKRLEVMQEYQGLCQECKSQGQIVPADVVDHIVELLDGGDELDNDNLIPLCHYHHNIKTRHEKNKRNSLDSEDETNQTTIDYIYI